MGRLAELLGESPGILAIRERLAQLLRHPTRTRRLPPVLIQGETGTGKGLLAHAIHRAGPRQEGPFIDVNCAAIPDALLEAEMFGFARGAFTDAREAKPGLLQAAHRGTIFLDEVGLLPETLQAKLLKAIEEQSIRRLGSTRSEPVDVWILSATSEDLALAARQRRFREDLYHRIAVLTVSLPPLRERGQDIVRLAEHFLARACADYDLPRKQLDAGAEGALLAHAWPGNVRELANLMERTALLSEDAVVTAEALALSGPLTAGPARGPHRDGAAALDDAVESLERARVLDALERASWNVSRAAVLLGISRARMRYRMERHGLRRGAARASARAARVPATERGARAAAAPAPGIAAALRWERRRLALLRADLLPSEGPDPPGRLLEALVEKLQGFGGRVEELSPTGFVAVFGVEAVEDAARRAALTGMAILKSVPEARVRIAIHVDQFLVARMGPAVELDAEAKDETRRVLTALVGAGEPGAIVVSAAAVPFLERRFEAQPLGRLADRPIEVYRLAGRERAGLGPSGRITRFAGRRAELEVLRARLAAAVTGQGQAVGVVGEPGLGKSRLLFEFRRSLARGEVSYLEGRCFSYASAVPYFPVVGMLRTHCRLSDADSPEIAADKVRRSLEQIGVESGSSMPYLLHLLGLRHGADPLAVLSPEAIRSRVFEILGEMTLQGSRRRPLVLALEDAHWIDSASEAYVASLVESLVGAPVLLVVTYRPGYRPAWMAKSYATQLALHPLSREESLAVVRSVRDTEPIPEPVARVIVDRADGNPFFLEELARVVGEQADVPLNVVPVTLEEVLRARIDQLPDEPRRLLQAASVLGREFSLRLLGAMREPAALLEAQLRELTGLEFLFTRRGPEEPVYVFKHALTQEVAYQSLSASERQALHAAAGRAFETLYPDRLEEVYDRLAYHYALSQDADKAMAYLTGFAVKAARASAHAEAIAALRTALLHADRLPAGPERERRRHGLILHQVYSLSFLGRYQEVLELLQRERAAVERLGAPDVSGPYYFWLARTYGVVGDHERAGEATQRALDEATRCADTATMGKAYYALAYEDYWSGRPGAGLDNGGKAVSLLDGTGELLWLGLAHWTVAINALQRGDFEIALAAVARTREIGDTIGDSGLRCTALWTSGAIQASRGEVEAGIAACQRAVDSSPNPINAALALAFLGGCHVQNRDAGRAIPALEQAAQQLGEFQLRQAQALVLALLSEAYLMTGQLDRATDLAHRAVRTGEEARYGYGVGWARRALGLVARARASLAEADLHFTESLRTFASVDARVEQARGHLLLAEVAHARGDRAALAGNLADARQRFQALRIPKYVERTEAMAREYGLPGGWSHVSVP